MGNVIDITNRLKQINILNTPDTRENAAGVVDISELRVKMIEDERRENKRVILNGFIGAHVIVPGRGLMKVVLYDIAKGGISFDLSVDDGQFKEKDEIAVRFYFNQSNYFPFAVKIVSTRVVPEEGVVRHGTHFIKGQTDEQAVEHFINFLESISGALKTDKGDLVASVGR